MNLPPLQADARLKCDIYAITTIAITIATYFLCYVPSIVYAVVGLQSVNQAQHWFGFSAWYCLYISSAVNPLIYYLRTNRFRSAFKQFLKDPLGSSDFIEKPRSRRNGKKRKVKVHIEKRDGEKTKTMTGKIRGVKIDVSQTKQDLEYSAVEKNNDRLILSMNNLPTQDPCISVLSFSWRKL